MIFDDIFIAYPSETGNTEWSKTLHNKALAYCEALKQECIISKSIDKLPLDETSKVFETKQDLYNFIKRVIGTNMSKEDFNLLDNASIELNLEISGKLFEGEVFIVDIKDTLASVGMSNIGEHGIGNTFKKEKLNEMFSDFFSYVLIFLEEIEPGIVKFVDALAPCTVFRMLQSNSFSGYSDIKLSLRLKGLRDKKGVTQKEVAEAVGLNPMSILNYEAGKRSPDTKTLYHLAKYYGCSTDYILGLDNFESKEDKIEALKQANILGDSLDKFDSNIRTNFITYLNKVLLASASLNSIYPKNIFMELFNELIANYYHAFQWIWHIYNDTTLERIMPIDAFRKSSELKGSINEAHKLLEKLEKLPNDYLLKYFAEEPYGEFEEE